jgi:succinate dehydrogenase/fumarate reductase flavoprotein subunit
MGYGFALEHSESRFDKSLIANNIVTPHEFGGISVCRDTLQARPGFFAAGQIVRGVFHSTNALWFNVLLTKRIARNLLKCE